MTSQSQSQLPKDNTLSIYIPHVFKNINSDFIKKVFEDLKYGKVKHLDFVDKMDKNGKD